MPTAQHPPEVTFGPISATVGDMSTALDFYVGLPGMRSTFTNGDPVGFVILRRDAAEVHLTLIRDHHAGLHNVAHLLVDDAAGLRDHPVRNGTRIVNGPRDTDHGMRGFVCCDPDGNRIDVGERW